MTTPIVSPDYPTRVKDGADWLDQVDPGWWRINQPGHGTNGGPIDLATMHVSDRCVLTQRWGAYAAAPIGHPDRVLYGFDILTDSDADPAEVRADYDRLTAAWTHLITQRRVTAVRTEVTP